MKIARQNNRCALIGASRVAFKTIRVAASVRRATRLGASESIVNFAIGRKAHAKTDLRFADETFH